MADQRKATDDDIPGPGAGQPPPRVARTENIPGDDTAGTLAQAAAGPGTSQAPAGLTAATTPGLLFGGALGRGGGSGAEHGGFSQSAPMTMLQQPLCSNPGAAPTAGAGDSDTAARVSSATVTATGHPDASSLTWHGGLAPPLGNPALGRGGGSGFSQSAPVTMLQPPVGNPVTIQSLITASRNRFLANRKHAQHGNASTCRGQGITVGQLDPHGGQSSTVPPEQTSSASIADRCFQCNTQIQRALVVDCWESYFCEDCWQTGNMPQGQEADELPQIGDVPQGQGIAIGLQPQLDLRRGEPSSAAPEQPGSSSAPGSAPDRCIICKEPKNRRVADFGWRAMFCETCSPPPPPGIDG